MAVTPGQTYRELPPPPALAAHVSCLWVQQVDPGAPAYTHRTIPNGGVELVCRVGSAPRIVGPRTGPDVQVLSGGETVVGARFRPGAAPASLGVPGSELVDLEIGFDEIIGPAAMNLGERVASASTPREALAALHGYLVESLAGTAESDPIVTEAVLRLMPWRSPDVGSLPSALHVSERHLRRRCRAAVGLAPKTLHRMLRFQGFVALAQLAMAQGRAPSADGLARLAAEAGYADQAHLTRESLRLAGLSPRAFLHDAEERCGAAHDHAASFVPLLRGRSG